MKPLIAAATAVPFGLAAACSPSAPSAEISARKEPDAGVNATPDVANATEPEPSTTTTVVLTPAQAEAPAIPEFVMPENVGAEQTDVEWAIRSAFGEAGDAAVATCESRLNPAAVNGEHAGLFQLSARWHQARAAKLGYAWSDMFSALPNIAVAHDLWLEQGWQPWTCKAA